MAPKLSFRLHCDSYCFLDSSGEFSISLFYDLEYDCPITIETRNTIFDPSAAFSHGLLEVIDTETGEKIIFSEPQSMKHDREEPSTENQLVVLEPHIKNNYSIWTTSSGNRINPKPHVFDPSPLSPRKSYNIRLRSHGIKTWYSGKHTDVTALPSTSGDPILEPSLQPGFTFKTRESTPKLPPLKPSIRTSSETLSISGNPRFQIIINWSFDIDREDVDPRGIAVLRSIPHGRNKAGIEIRDVETGKRRGPALGWRPPDDGPEPPEEVEVLKFSADEDGTSCVERSYTLITNKDEAGIFGTDTRALRPGHNYVVGQKKGPWAWMTRKEVGEDVWEDEDKLRQLLLQEPRCTWQPDVAKELKAVE